MSKKETNALSTGQAVMALEAQAIVAAAQRLDARFEKAVACIAETQGKVVFCGIGKSGHIAKKLSTSLMSIGIDSVFLHASEAIHGDLGIYKPGDLTIILSKSGATAELVRLMPVFKSFESKVIAILGRIDSPIGQSADIVLDASVEKEADPLNLMPTASASVALALGDALASAVLQSRGFTSEEFARYHPGGQLGRNLLVSVGDVMHGLDKVACLHSENTLRDAVLAMTEHPLGAACILAEDQTLEGIITDGDIRRLLTQTSSVLEKPLHECLTKEALTVNPDCRLREALRMMEDRPSQISVVPVVDKASHRLLGLLRLHDIYQTNFS